MSDKLVKYDQLDAISCIPEAEIHVELENGKQISGVVREITDDAILIYQPYRGAVIWVRRDQVILASNMAIWM